VAGTVDNDDRDPEVPIKVKYQLYGPATQVTRSKKALEEKEQKTQTEPTLKTLLSSWSCKQHRLFFVVVRLLVTPSR